MRCPVSCHRKEASRGGHRCVPLVVVVLAFFTHCTHLDFASDNLDDITPELLLNGDYDDLEWTSAAVAAAKEFEEGDFDHPFKKTSTITRLIKEALLVFPNDGTQVQLRHITERDGIKYIMGYVQKDEGAGHYERISYNMSVEEMSEGKEFYNARKKTPLTTAYRLDPKNLHTEAFKWYRQYMYPIPPPNLNQTVLYMVTSGMYLPCTRWTLGGLSNSMDWPAAQQLWTMMHFPESTNANDVARTLFRQSDPGDPIYGEMNWAEVQMQVKSMRDCQLQADAQFDTQDMHDTATAQAYDESQDFWGSISASSGNVRAPGAMPAGCSMATAEEVAANIYNSDT